MISSDRQRWLNELEVTPQLWESLPLLGEGQFLWQGAEARYRGPLQLGTAFLVHQGPFLISEPSLTLEPSLLDRVYISETGDGRASALEVDFPHRRTRLEVTGSDHLQEKLSQLAAIFGWEMKPETQPLAARRALRESPLCPCCTEACEQRVAGMSNHPLAWILADRIDAGEGLFLTLATPGAHLAALHRPQSLHSEGPHLVSRGEEGEFALDMRHLYSLRTHPVRLDGEEHLQLTLMNTRGEEMLSLAAPSASVSRIWPRFLGAVRP
ncbi:hypothetical protein [Roseibacillus ishigakijimensis]|uniref:Uncharacterized protein n=1 Tax=Roseibacillus ishigakijimensis TaxID=454146 RepID=A0A934RN03_9BACT|nr:hypothetical protein [Roseibacillus ishigakijimensis]MBK1833770.1 hypothetical protein [Roseibacillus ishigakijimensis]